MYIIVGANGFLGSYLIKNILHFSEDSILALGRNIQNEISTERMEWMKCDVENIEDILKVSQKIKDYKEVKVIYLAAYHHPDLVEKNFRKAWNVNITGLSNFMNYMENIHSFFYPSTDTVYGEGSLEHCFTENDKLSPENQYGKQKVAAESLVKAYGYNVVRFPFLISPSLLKDKKHFYDQIVDKLKNNDPIEMFEDSYRSALSFDTGAQLLIRLIEKSLMEKIPDTINIASDIPISKYDIGLRIAKKLNVDPSLIIPIKMEMDHKIFKAKRAKSTVMDNQLIKSILDITEIKLEI